MCAFGRRCFQGDDSEMSAICFPDDKGNDAPQPVWRPACCLQIMESPRTISTFHTSIVTGSDAGGFQHVERSRRHRQPHEAQHIFQFKVSSPATETIAKEVRAFIFEVMNRILAQCVSWARPNTIVSVK